MNDRIASARPLGRTLTATLAAAGLALGMTLALTHSTLAQQPAAPAKKAPAKPAPAPQPQATAPAAPASPQLPPLMYSSWVKLCQKGPETDNKQVCVVHKDGRMETGMPAVMAEFLQVEGAKERLRAYVPLAITVHLAEGTRVLIDQTPLATAPYVTCIQLGCFAEYEASPEIITKMKTGQMMTIQAYLMNGSIIDLPLPLSDFAKAYDGPATDPKVIEEQQRKLQDELQKKADEARKKLESQQPSAAAPK